MAFTVFFQGGLSNVVKQEQLSHSQIWCSLPKVRVTKMAGTRALINEYSLQSEILKTGMGVSNPEHLDVLRELLQDSVVNQTKDGGPTNG